MTTLIFSFLTNLPPPVSPQHMLMALPSIQLPRPHTLIPNSHLVFFSHYSPPVHQQVLSTLIFKIHPESSFLSRTLLLPPKLSLSLAETTIVIQSPYFHSLYSPFSTQRRSYLFKELIMLTAFPCLKPCFLQNRILNCFPGLCCSSFSGLSDLT